MVFMLLFQCYRQTQSLSNNKVLGSIMAQEVIFCQFHNSTWENDENAFFWEICMPEAVSEAYEISSESLYSKLGNAYLDFSNQQINTSLEKNK
jgi:hypothetical protein